MSLYYYPSLFSESLVGDMFGVINNFERTFSKTINKHWSPDTDVHENDTEIEIIADIPGLSKNDIEVDIQNTVNGYTLTLKGERKHEVNDKKKYERYHGKFERKIHLPSNIDEEKISSSLTDGVLRITIPKTAVNNGRKRIDIQ